MLRKISTFTMFLIVVLAVSLIPLGVSALVNYTSTETEVARSQADQLELRVIAHGEGINEQLKAFSHMTEMAATEAKNILLEREGFTIDEETVEERLEKYQRDDENIYGLDIWYNEVYEPEYGDDRQSNVYVNQSTEVKPEIAYDIAATESLNALFGAIKDSEIGTQWIYLTTEDGMMRLYPWHPNNYGPDWEPQTITFYTVANEERNPERESIWTNPYNDYAEAGVMVTNSVPIYDGDDLIAVMSHDMRIEDIQAKVLDFKVGEQGYAFLLDAEGNIIAHKDYTLEDTPRGEELSIKLGAESPAIAPVVESMLNKGKGTQEYVDENGQRWMVSFTVIDTTDWHLGLVLPYDEIIQPAVSIASRGGAIAIALVAVVIVVAILLAQIISRPIKRLSETAQRVEASVDQENISTEEFDTSSEISGTREIAELHSAFGEMVNALQKRMNELRSLYAIGQAITSNVEYEDTLNAVLSAVEEVVKYDAAEVSVLRGQKLVVEAWKGREDFNDTKGREYKVGKGSLVGVIAETEDTLFMPTVEYSQNMNLTLGYDQSLEREFLDRTSKIVIESFLGIPLLVGDRIIGTLTLVHHEAEHFTEDDRRQLNKLAAQASIAIDNALKVRARELNLQRQIQELKFEIDEAKKEKQVEEIVETEYFQNLRARAKKIRGRNRGGDEETQEETQEENADET